MRNENTFGLHFILRTSRSIRGKSPIYARIVVNQSRCELALKCLVRKADWNSIKGAAKPTNEELKQLNSYLEEIRGKLVRQYRALHVNDAPLSAEIVKNAYLGIDKKKRLYTLLWVVAEHNQNMHHLLRPGTMKNYLTTEKYLKAFIAFKFKRQDLGLQELTYEFISSFEFYVRSHSIKPNDLTNNGTMKHMERLKKMVTWAVKNEWLEKNPFTNFHLKFNRHERDCLNALELAALEDQELTDPMLHTVRDLFTFSCYTGLAYVDLINLKTQEIITAIDGVEWIKTTREKTGVSVNIPLLSCVLPLLDKYLTRLKPLAEASVFPVISNQVINRSLKIIAEICGIKKYLTFHLARHTFATTVTLMNDVPIETISKMLGHTKLSTTMVYARVTACKIGMDMSKLENKIRGYQDKKQTVR